ncbi:MAG: hypothetical protein R3C61_13965 [Bacteroidia bacterium]
MARIILLSFALLFSIHSQSQLRIRVMHYNLLSFGPPCTNVTITNKYNWLGTILEQYRPHLFTVNELGPNIAYANGIKSLSFDYTDRVSYADFTNNANANIVNQLFYDNEIFAYTGVEVIGGFLRDINVYHLYIKPTTTTPGVDTVFLDCIVAHYKAGDTQTDANTRANMAQAVMNYINAKGKGRNILVMGDFNVYSHNEAAFQTMVFNPDSTIRLIDPAGKQNGWNGSANAIIHTQSPRQSSQDCGSGGGMDDRFDFILASAAIMGDTAGIGYVPGTYAAYGNDGNSYNQELLCSNSGSVPATVCSAMKQMSDHLPVVMQLEVPGITAVDKQTHFQSTLRVFTAPEKGEIKLMFDNSLLPGGPAKVRLFSLWGQELSVLEIAPGVNEAVISGVRIPAGVYFLRWENEKGWAETKKIEWR